MVIQRLQTLYLILAIVMVSVFFYVPFGYTTVADVADGVSVLEPLRAGQFTGLVIPLALTLVLMVVAIFMFKKMPMQKLMVLVSALLTVVSMGVVVYVMVSGFSDTNPQVTMTSVWGGGGLLLVGALIAQLAAYNGISSDQRLLRSYDRLR